MKKAISLVIAAVLGLSLLAGCGAGTSDDKAASPAPADTAKTDDTAKQDAKTAEKPVNLRFVFWDPPTKDGVEAINKSFMEANPNVTIESEIAPGDKYEQVIKTRILAGDAPDLFMYFASSAYKMAKDNYWGDLTGASWASSVMPAYIDSSSYEGKLYALTLDYATYGVWYNKKVFADAGITEMPKTYADFLSICEKLKAKGITPIGAGGKDSWSPAHLTGLLYSAFTTGQNPSWQTDLYDGKAKFTDKTGYRTMLEKFVQLTDLGYIPKGSLGVTVDQVAADIANGKTAMTIMGSWMPSQILGKNKDAQIGVFALPDEAGKITTIGLPDKALGYAASGKNTEVAKKVIEFWAKPEEMQKYVDVTGSLCAVKGVTSKNLPAIMSELQTVMEKAEVYSFPNAFFPASTTEENDKALQSILAGSKDVDKIVDTLQKSYDRDKANIIRPTLK